MAGLKGRIYLDLADELWRAVEIDAEGWRVVEAPPVRFRRPRYTLPLPEPARGGDIFELGELLNVREEDLPLLFGFLVMCLNPEGPYPILALSGGQGTGKTTAARIMRSLIDPNEGAVRSLPRDEKDLMISAANGAASVPAPNTISVPCAPDAAGPALPEVLELLLQAAATVTIRQAATASPPLQSLRPTTASFCTTTERGRA